MSSIYELREKRKQLEYQKNNILYVVVKEGRLLHEQENMELVCLHKQILEINKQIKKLSNKEGEKKDVKGIKNSKKFNSGSHERNK